MGTTRSRDQGLYPRTTGWALGGGQRPGAEADWGVSTEPPDDLSCLTTPGVGRLRDGPLRVGGALAQGLGIRLFAFGGAYWPLATAHPDPLWARTCFGCVNGAPG